MSEPDVIRCRIYRRIINDHTWYLVDVTIGQDPALDLTRFFDDLDLARAYSQNLRDLVTGKEVN